MCAGRIALAVDGKNPINFFNANKLLFGIEKEDTALSKNLI